MNRLRMLVAPALVVASLFITGGIAKAAVDPLGPRTGRFNFAFTVPRFGSQTFTSKSFKTTDNYNDINIQYDVIPSDLSVKPVRCGDLTDISGYKDISAGDHTWKVIASNVRDGVCYYLNMNAGTTDSFDVSGNLHS